MNILNKRYSPSDLVAYWESRFAFQMDRLAAARADLRPFKNPPDPLADALKRKGLAHEDALVQDFVEQGKTVIRIESNSSASAATVSAMSSGAEVIVQGCLASPPFLGYADFLVKVPGKSLFGDYCYQVWDAKLSGYVKPAFVIQLCCYVDMLSTIQQAQADDMVVALGGGEFCVLPVIEFLPTYSRLKKQFLTEIDYAASDLPDPMASRQWGDWSGYAESLLVERDHLLQVADISRSQIKKLNAAGVQTLTQLAHSAPSRVAGMHPQTLIKLQAQARIQKQGENCFPPLFELITPEPHCRQGLALLPPHSDQDVFFDIEGYPLVDGGLEYLWGCTYFNEQGERIFRDFWAHNSQQEKQSFQEFIMWIYQRWCDDPTMHIYHYANYEIAACRKLMGRYGVCEQQVDQLLRHHVFVDLYKVVKTGLLLGESRYSIKNVEHLYRGQRQTEVGNGADSVVAYELWREKFSQGLETQDWQNSPILRELRLYNQDDCDSTQELVVWLREQQAQSKIAYVAVSSAVEEPLQLPVTPLEELREALLAQAERCRATDESWSQVIVNVAWMLEFHKRENKPVFWRLYDRLSQEPHTLLDDLGCLALCQRTDRAPYKNNPRARNLIYQYEFDSDQEFKGASLSFYVLANDIEPGETLKVTWCEEESDMAAGLLALSASAPPPDELSLIPDEYVRPDPIPQAIEALATRLLDGSKLRGAIWDFLLRKPPVFNTIRQGAIVKGEDAEQQLQSIIDAVEDLRDSYLVIQGPPGAGKTHTAKHIIARLLAQGARVGITSNSHKAINHLLISCAEYCMSHHIPAHFVCTKETDSKLVELQVNIRSNSQIAKEIKPRCVIGTTAWGFAKDALLNQLDYLFVDEAGQVSLANLFAMSGAAKNLVLLGDQMQLGQPSQAEHPEQSGLSCLDYLLHDSPTIEADKGVFLGTTYRMHSAINEFISTYIYNGKLCSAVKNDQRCIPLPAQASGRIKKAAGILFIPVEHQGNSQASDEEVAVIVECVQELLQREVQLSNEQRRPLTLGDMLFVAPYNHQVKKLRQALGPHAKIGSVDKFQGQEAPVVFFSFCSSDLEDSPRGMDFLLDKHRINVAISRAQCLAVVVGNPALGVSNVSNLKQLKQLGLFNALLAYSN